MCGIAGWVSYDGDLKSHKDVITTMTKTMARRGPDAGGVWIDRHVGLGHRRLAVIDLAGGVQPMQAEELGQTTVSLIYTGEVYNFVELREELKQLGHQFKTRSDIEVVLRGYLQWRTGRSPSSNEDGYARSPSTSPVMAQPLSLATSTMLNELDPQVKALLEQFHANAAQHPAPATSFSAKEKIIATRQMTGTSAALRCPSESVSRTEDFAIPGPAGKIPVRLYVPHTIIQSGWRGIRDDPLPIAAPVLVYYRGGGFVAGDLESQDSLLRALANRSRCIVISVAYRLAPENPYLAANDDAWAALTWVADHASEIGADPQRLAFGGDSAGGLLAAWAAQKAAKNGPRLRLQVLLYPNLDATTSRPSWKELGTGAYLVSHAQMIEWYDAYLPPGINRKAPEVSPLFATDLTGVASAFIITADHDPLHDEGDEYAAKLKAANVAVDLTCWPGSS